MVWLASLQDLSLGKPPIAGVVWWIGFDSQLSELRGLLLCSLLQQVNFEADFNEHIFSELCGHHLCRK